MKTPTREEFVEALGNWRKKHIWMERLKIEQYNGQEDAELLEQASFELDEAERSLLLLYRLATGYETYRSFVCNDEKQDIDEVIREASKANQA